MSRKNFGVEFDLFEDFENIEGNNVLKESVLKAIEESQNLDAAERGSRIEDFGEKIGGARKDLYEAYYELMKSAVTTELESAPLSKTFPVPNYNKLIERGIERWKVDAIRSLRDAIPPKPRRYSWLLREWAEEAGTLRDMAISVLEDKWTQEEFSAELEKIKTQDSEYEFGTSPNASVVQKIKDKMLMYGMLGHDFDCSALAFFELDKYEYFGSSVELREMHGTFRYRVLASGETREDVLERYKLQERAQEKSQRDKKNLIKVYSWKNRNYYFIGCKVGKEYVELKAPFETPAAAATYMQSHIDELEELLGKYRYIPYERESENAPRIGTPRRNGDVTPEEFQRAFGFRGVEFGEWVENKSRQEDLNKAYESLMDLAEALNLPPRALSLDGSLGLAFGSRGKGGKNAPLAHYEHEKVVINLTKKNGAGSLGHEWFHALDNYFGRKETGAASAMITGNINGAAPRHVSEEIMTALEMVREVINRSKLPERCRNLDRRRNTEYWTLPEEMAARTFEVYLKEKLRASGISNDYLVNYRSEESWQQATENGFKMDGTYPYPTADEIEDIKAVYDYLFDSIRFKAHNQEYELYSASNGKIDEKLIESRLLLPQELTAEQRVLQEMSENALGIEVKYFAGAAELHGRYDRDADIIYVNGEAETSVEWTFWHEAFHLMKRHEPELYADILSHVERQEYFSRQQIENYRASVNQREMSKSEVLEEMLADAFADLKTGRRVIEKMAGENSSLAERFVAFTKKLLTGVKNFFKAKETREKYPSVVLTNSQFRNFVKRVEENISDISNLRRESAGYKILKTRNIRHSPYKYAPAKQKIFDTEAAAALAKKYTPSAVQRVIQEISPLGRKNKRYGEEILREVQTRGR